MSAIDRLLENNARFAAGFDEGGLPAPPSTQVAVVACMDARLETGSLLGLAAGQVHIIRNAGGVVTDDVIRSLTISQRLLGTREIMLIHHTKCGMREFRSGELKDAIEKDIGLRPSFSFESFSDIDASVRQSIARIHASPFIPHKHAVRGFVCDVDTGRLREVE